MRRTARKLLAILDDPDTARLLNTHSSTMTPADLEAKANVLKLGAAAFALGTFVDALADESDLIEVPRTDAETVRHSFGTQPEARS